MLLLLILLGQNEKPDMTGENEEVSETLDSSEEETAVDTRA